MIIAIDIGGTKISAALISHGKVIQQRKTDSIIHSNLSNLASHLAELCHGWKEQSTHVAVACTGQVGNQYVNFLSVKQKIPLKSLLHSCFGLPVTIINDAAAAAWAEYWIERCNNNQVIDDTLTYITVSTGVGGGMIQNGQLITSADGFCAHLGHTSVQHLKNERIRCHCGRVNCAEALASGTAIATQASKILNKTVSCKEVFHNHLHVDEISTLIESATSAITDLIANVKATTGCNKVILGGSVGSAPLFFQQVVEKVALLPEIYRVAIIPPQCGANADLIGAYYYVQQYVIQNN
ncbi:ROK family protein [Shewanella sp. MBTL60-007]|uniref:ROK family protein n=1 Tax=Shewanella sp. MBTL60-007 TaxID=2815911 RepID=UPI001BBAE625|nr:ROK family protein [Shewanella sp. MBTL60-007]GIU15216.1 N-acetylmannosamine kinase [Shewanella sp. MBTL60-007]